MTHRSQSLIALMFFREGTLFLKLFKAEVDEFFKARYVVFSSPKTSMECCKTPFSIKQK